MVLERAYDLVVLIGLPRAGHTLPATGRLADGGARAGRRPRRLARRRGTRRSEVRGSGRIRVATTARPPPRGRRRTCRAHRRQRRHRTGSAQGDEARARGNRRHGGVLAGARVVGLAPAARNRDRRKLRHGAARPRGDEPRPRGAVRARRPRDRSRRRPSSRLPRMASTARRRSRSRSSSMHSTPCPSSWSATSRSGCTPARPGADVPRAEDAPELSGRLARGVKASHRIRHGGGRRGGLSRRRSCPVFPTRHGLSDAERSRFTGLTAVERAQEFGAFIPTRMDVFDFYRRLLREDDRFYIQVTNEGFGNADKATIVRSVARLYLAPAVEVRATCRMRPSCCPTTPIPACSRSDIPSRRARVCSCSSSPGSPE